MKWDAKIARTRNGFILEYKDDEGKLSHLVFEDEDELETDEEVKPFASLLWALQDLLGPSGSKHSRKRVYILIRPGTDHETFTEKHSEQIWGKDDTEHSEVQREAKESSEE